MARDYEHWYNKRGSTSQRLNNIPHLTTDVDGLKRYYSSIDAEIYLGDIFIDEITEITWTVQQQVTPLYGYNSYTTDDFAVGSRLVQGQFAVNFIKRNFLMSLQNDSKFNRIARKLYGKDIPANSTFPSGFRRRLNMPIWDHGFDIVVGFGDHGGISNLKNNMYSTYVILDCCQLLSSTIQLDATGKPVYEVYTFLARDIKHDVATFNSDNSTIPSNPQYNNDISNKDTNNQTVTDDIKLSGNIDLTAKEGKIIFNTSNDIELHSGKLTLLDDFKNKQLNMSLDLVNDNNMKSLIYTLDINKTKELRLECVSNSINKLSCELEFSYTENKTKTYKKVKTKILLNIKR